MSALDAAIKKAHRLHAGERRRAAAAEGAAPRRRCGKEYIDATTGMIDMLDKLSTAA